MIWKVLLFLISTSINDHKWFFYLLTEVSCIPNCKKQANLVLEYRVRINDFWFEKFYYSSFRLRSMTVNEFLYLLTDVSCTPYCKKNLVLEYWTWLTVKAGKNQRFLIWDVLKNKYRLNVKIAKHYRINSYKNKPQATETLSDWVLPFMGIW